MGYKMEKCNARCKLWREWVEYETGVTRRYGVDVDGNKFIC